MLSLRRRFMGANAKPYDAEIEYLESQNAGNEELYIDTNFHFKSGMKIEFVYENTNFTKGNKPYFGTSNNGSIYSGEVAFFYYEGRESYTYYDVVYPLNQSSSVYESVKNPDFKGKIKFNMDSYKYSFEFDKRMFTFRPSGFATDYESNYPIILFGMNRNGPNFFSAFRLYSFIIQDEITGIQYLNLIPVRIGDAGYMYDKVSGELFGNVGAPGSRFILGPDI